MRVERAKPGHYMLRVEHADALSAWLLQFRAQQRIGGPVDGLATGFGTGLSTDGRWIRGIVSVVGHFHFTGEWPPDTPSKGAVAAHACWLRKQSDALSVGRMRPHRQAVVDFLLAKGINPMQIGQRRRPRGVRKKKRL